MVDWNRDAEAAAIRNLSVAVGRLQEAAALAGLQKIDLQLTGADDHMRLRFISSALEGVRIDHRRQGEDTLAGARIYPAHARPNKTGT